MLLSFTLSLPSLPHTPKALIKTDQQTGASHASRLSKSIFGLKQVFPSLLSQTEKRREIAGKKEKQRQKNIDDIWICLPLTQLNQLA